MGSAPFNTGSNSIAGDKATPRAFRSAGNLELWASCALLLLYLALMSGHLHSIDGLLVYNQAKSLAFEQSFQFGEPLWPGSTSMTSKYGLGLSLLYVPGLLVFSWLRAYAPVPTVPFDPVLFYADTLYTVALAPLHAVVIASTAYLVALLCREMDMSRAASLWGLALYGLGSPAIIYSKGDWNQPLEGLCWMAALYAAVRFRRTGSLATLLGLGAAVCYAFLTRPVEGTLVFLAVVVLLAPSLHLRQWHKGSLYGVAVVVGSYSVGMLITMLANWGRYGNPMNFVGEYEGEGWTNPILVGLAGTLISPGRGILWQFPAVLLLLFEWKRIRWGVHRKTALVLAGLVGVQVLNVSAWVIWWGGWNWGLRLLVPALPLLAVLAAGSIDVLPRARRHAPMILLLLGLLWSSPGVVTDMAAGYGAKFNSTNNFFLDAHPFIGAWTYLHHWFGDSLTDVHGIDILWFRLARQTDFLSLIVPILLTATAAVLAVRIARQYRSTQLITEAVGPQLNTENRLTVAETLAEVNPSHTSPHWQGATRPDKAGHQQ
jgi:hypothetical protein